MEEKVYQIDVEILKQLKKKKDKVSPDIVNNYKLKCLVFIKHKEKLFWKNLKKELVKLIVLEKL